MALNGCMNWTQIIASHVQIIAITPFFVILYKKSRVAFLIFTIMVCMATSAASCIVFWRWRLTVGTLTFEDYFLFALITEKTYNKMITVMFAYYLAWIYQRIVAYREADLEAKQTKFKVIHYFHQYRWVNWVVFLTGWGLVNVIFLVPFKENQDSYLWTRQ